MQRAVVKESNAHSILGLRLRKLAALISICLLCVVPLTFLTTVHRFYTLPRFVLLLAGSSILAAILGLLFVDSRREDRAGIGTRQLTLVSLYVLWIAGSTIFGVAPVVSLFGSFENQMGLLTHSCFLVCFLGLVAGVRR